MKFQVDKNSNDIQRGYLVTVIVAIIGVLFKTMQLVMFFDKKTGMIANQPFANIFHWISVACMIVVVLITLNLSTYIVPTTRFFELGTPRIAGYILFCTTILFILQGMIDLSGHIMDYLDLNTRIAEGNLNDATKTSLLIPNIFSMVVDVFCLLSALSFYVLAMEYVREDDKKHLVLYLIPVIWSALVLVNVIIAAPSVVSIQSNGTKAILSILVIAFLYFVSLWACGYEPRQKTFFSLFVRMAFPTVSMVMVIPYLISFLFGVRDNVMNVPFLSILGLSLYGVVVMLQFLSGCCFQLDKRKRNYK